MIRVNRRKMLTMSLAASGALVTSAMAVRAASSASLIVARTPSCGCCGAWIDKMREAGFTVEDKMMDELTALKAQLGVPENLHSCHTAIIAGFVIEGHVPADDIKRLLKERPQVLGIAVAGMPIGSPGMEQDGQSEQYETIAFGLSGQFVFAKH